MSTTLGGSRNRTAIAPLRTTNAAKRGALVARVQMRPKVRTGVSQFWDGAVPVSLKYARFRSSRGWHDIRVRETP